MPLIRLGTASPSTQSTTAETLRLLSSIARRASAQKIDILLLPEAFIGGYPHDRVNKTREAFAEYFDQAVDLGDTAGGAGAGDAWAHRELGEERRGDGTREELEEIARSSGVFLVTGVIEKVGGCLYGSVVYVCPRLGIIGKRRKVNPTDIERLFWAQGAPSTLHAVSTTIRGVRVNLAAAICWESYMPMVRQALYAQNINLYLAPNSDDGENWLNCMQTIGFEGRCFVVGSNMCLRGRSGEAGGQANRLNGIGSAMERHRGGPSMPSAPPLRRRRRKSVFDDDGNEIVLSCPAEEDEAPGLVPNGVSETNEDDKVGDLPSAPPARRRRRKSVFDDDGNEIVLCCPDDGTSSAEPNSVAATGTETSEAYKGPWTSRGGSCIVSPFGKVLAGPQWEDDQGLIYADVDFRDCVRGRLDLDVAGTYACNDSFKFSVEGLNLNPLPY
uniref:CN hydrolase domain-containing protein n=1 Tax=Bionectria ochroleuca TaxID=29856 RepID=A0A8H7NEY9_BIOOC